MPVVVMPALGESVSEGTVVRWLKSVGDPVAADEPLLEVSTDKVETAIPSPFSGTVLAIEVGEDGTARVGAALAVIGAASPEPSGPSGPAPSPEPSAPGSGPPPGSPAAATAGSTAGAEIGRVHV